MTRLWAYGDQAADGRVSNPAAACYPIMVRETSAGLRPAQVRGARDIVEHRSLAVGVAVSTVPVATRRNQHRPAGDRHPLAPTRFPRLLALEVPPRRWQSTD
jgi:hypothetical protein